MEQLVLIYLVIVNVMVFIMYGMDKRKAKRKKWRIPESSLILSAFLGGAFGAFLGMQLFHHKTKHAKFLVLVPLAMLMWIVIIYLVYIK
jgi:uncharacterized membrane protein YsdA (DUF1294 family)